MKPHSRPAGCAERGRSSLAPEGRGSGRGRADPQEGRSTDALERSLAARRPKAASRLATAR